MRIAPTSRPRTVRAATLTAVCVLLAVASGPASALAQVEDPVDPGTVTTDGMTEQGDTGTATTEAGEQPAGSATGETPQGTQPSPVDPTTPDSEAATRDEAQEMFESPTAAGQPGPAKVAEQKDACAAGRRLPASDMLGVANSVVRPRSGSKLVVVLGIAAAVAALGVLVWRFRGRWRASGERGLLGDVGTAIAILGGIIGLAVQFVPGLGVRERPPPQASMAVKQVHARVPHENYARTLGVAQRAEPIDRKELGNVIWVELGLEGYKDTDLALQWGEYNLDTGGSLLRGTDGRRTVRVRSDAETQFVPVWVGYPRTGRFQVQLRLLKGREVRAMARTGEMRGTRYRFACGR